MPKSTEMMANFKKEYDLDISIEEVEKSLKSFRYLNDFMNEKTNFESKSTTYVHTLANLLHHYLENKLSPMYYRRSLDLTDVNVEKFINDFEKIMAKRRDEHDLTISQEPFGGLGSKLYDQLLPQFQSLNKPVADLWTKSILEGKVDPMDLKTDTEQIFNDMKDKKPPLKETEERTLELAVLTYKAMNQVYQKRTLWKAAPWNWRQWYREAKYINKLGEQLKTYRNNGLPIDKIEQKYSTPHLKNIGDKLVAAKHAAAQVEANELNRKAEEKKQELANQKVTATENLKQVTADPTFKDKFIDDVVKDLPQTQSSDSMKKDILSMAFNNMVNTMKIQNANFDDEFGDPKKYVVNGAKAIFKNAYISANTFGCKNREECLAVAQIITDKVMQKLSPAAVDQTYAMFANGYALKHAEEFNNALGAGNKVDDAEVANVFANARKLYGELTREPFVLEEFLNVRDNDVVEPVKQNDNVKDISIQK